MALLRNRGNSLCAGTTVLAVAAIVFLGYPAEADQPTGDCVVTPGEERPLEQQDTTAGIMTECDGVLKPAPVGDAELVEPAPEKGRTPVIEPGEIPARPSPGDDPAAPAGD
ncbi:hypothetical protein [Roseibium sp. Sym1]|uniref:hypothetical protein n=1 Tax=Roseibium sp. Sym1 TaxID=3016006 RepID=UPI0022B43C54|nr:hypothetical protein [Roseibium sp. Sym1]